jgi:hypothetical protein
MARIRHERDARAVINEEFWNWYAAGCPEPLPHAQAMGEKWWFEHFACHWHVCAHCGEDSDARVRRLMSKALDDDLIAFTDDPVMDDDSNLARIGAVLEEIEPSMTWEQWSNDHQKCRSVDFEEFLDEDPACKEAISDGRRTARTNGRMQRRHSISA